MNYKYFVLLGALAYWPAAIYMVHKWPGGGQKSYSLHAASNKQAYRLFAVAVTLETAFYLLFTFKWFIPHFDMPFIFGLLTVLILLGHFITGIIPETKGLSKQIHRKASYGVAVLFIPALFIIAMTPAIPGFARVLAGSYVLVMLLLWFIYVVQPHKRQEGLIVQTLFISALPITLIAATYLR